MVDTSKKEFYLCSKLWQALSCRQSSSKPGSCKPVNNLGATTGKKKRRIMAVMTNVRMFQTELEAIYYVQSQCIVTCKTPDIIN